LAKVIPFPARPKPSTWNKIERWLWDDNQALDTVTVGICALAVVYIIGQVIRVMING